eukprot:5520359-Amphidinium_carterae.1
MQTAAGSLSTSTEIRKLQATITKTKPLEREEAATASSRQEHAKGRNMDTKWSVQSMWNCKH